jgi:hypothetical protein
MNWLEWFDRLKSPKALNRSGGRWKCMLGGVVNGRGVYAYGWCDTPEDAISEAASNAKKTKRMWQLRDELEAERVEREGEPNVAVRMDEDDD